MANTPNTFEKKNVYAYDLKVGDIIIVDGRHTFTVTGTPFRVGGTTTTTFEVHTKEFGFIRFEEFKELNIERPVPPAPKPTYKVGTIAASDDDNMLRIRKEDGWHKLFAYGKIETNSYATDYWTDETIAQAIKHGSYGFRIVFEPKD